jgi:integrase
VADLGRKRGKRVRISRSHKKKGVVARWLRETLRDHARGIDVRRVQQPLAGYLTEWLAWVKENRTPGTYTRYKSIVEAHLLPNLGARRLGELSVADLEDYIAEQQQAGLPNSVIKINLAILGTALRRAVKKGWLERNVVRMIDLPVVQKAAVGKAYSPEEVRQLYGAAATDPRGILYVVLVATGLRLGEALGLRWQDLDWEAPALLVQGQLLWDAEHKQFRLGRPKTRTSTRLIGVPAALVGLLRIRRLEQQQERRQAGGLWQEPVPDLVFTTEQGLPWHKATINRHFHKFLATAGVPSGRPHDLRHTCSALLQNHGVDERVVGAILGHEGKSITSRVYGHPDWPSLQRAAQIMDDLLRGPR